LTQSADPTSETSAGTPLCRALWRFLPIALVVAAVVAVYATGWHRELSLEALISHRTAVDRFVAGNGVLAVLIYVGVVTLSLPGGLLVTVLGGLLFGVAAGSLGGIIGATIGGTVMFVIARTAFGGRLFSNTSPAVTRLIDGFRDDAFNYVLALRLTPTPFQIVNLVPALLNIPLRTFVLATAIGVIPTRLVFAGFGASLDAMLAPQVAVFKACVATGGSSCRVELDLSAALSPQIVACLAALCVIALVPVAVKRWRANTLARAQAVATRADG
jgi:uncharacterized membrane protein YdjX (TVP38/TMEM64 family)